MENLFVKLKSTKGFPLLLITLIVGIMFTAVGSIDSEKDDEISVTEEKKIDADEYTEKLEERIGRMIRGFTGRDCLVMVTLESGGEQVYARNGGAEGSYVIIDQKSGEGDGALLIRSEMPVVAGAAVICGVNESTRLEIINMLSALLNIPAGKIYVK